MRTLSLLIAILFLFYHAASLYISTYLPENSFYISFSTIGYACYGVGLSVLGMVGAIRRSPDLLSMFANHVYFDTVMSTIPKMGVLFVFHDLTRNVCTPGWASDEQTASSTTAGAGPALSDNNAREDRCQSMIVGTQVLLAGIMILWTVGQWSLATSVRRYGRTLETCIAGRKDIEQGLTLPAYHDEKKTPDGGELVCVEG